MTDHDNDRRYAHAAQQLVDALPALCADRDGTSAHHLRQLCDGQVDVVFDVAATVLLAALADVEQHAFEQLQRCAVAGQLAFDQDTIAGRADRTAPRRAVPDDPDDHEVDLLVNQLAAVRVGGATGRLDDRQEAAWTRALLAGREVTVWHLLEAVATFGTLVAAEQGAGCR